MMKRICFLTLVLLLTFQSTSAQYRTRYNEFSLRWAKTLFIEPPLFHIANAFPIGFHYTRHFENEHGFQLEIGGEFQDLSANEEVYSNGGKKRYLPYLRGFADGSIKWLYPIYQKKPFRLHAIGGPTYRKMVEAYMEPGADLAAAVFTDFIGVQAGIKMTLNLGRFFALGLSQEYGAFYTIRYTGFHPQMLVDTYVTSTQSFTTRLSFGFCF